jgi:hypothetical protein
MTPSLAVPLVRFRYPSKLRAYLLPFDETFQAADVHLCQVSGAGQAPARKSEFAASAMPRFMGDL